MTSFNSERNGNSVHCIWEGFLFPSKAPCQVKGIESFFTAFGKSLAAGQGLGDIPLQKRARFKPNKGRGQDLNAILTFLFHI
jgi:hypothetical protein